VARPLTRPAHAADRRRWWTTLALVLLLHALALALLQRVLQPPSLLRDMAPPFYTRSIAPETPVPATAAAPAQAQPSKPNRPSARIQSARAATKKEANTPPAPTDQAAAAAPEPAASAALADAAPPPGPAPTDLPTPSADAGLPAPPPAPVAAASTPAAPASAATPAFVASWPGDTRLSYQLGGHYRGELHGSARVLWQRAGTRYQAVVELNAGLLASLSFSSQGEITATGLHPEVYEENVRGRRRGVRLGEQLRLNSGEQVPRPDGVQDTASQFVELAHRFATGQLRPAAGQQIRFALARPGGVDEWTYDVVGEETLHLPRLGAVATWHLKPRRIDKPRGPLTAEMWFAPSLQYLPVRIRISQDADTYLDLLADTIEQQ
jgi:hypothetical protein